LPRGKLGSVQPKADGVSQNAQSPRAV
jgi:hypothetical protein